MKVLFASFLAVHGLLHLMGAAKGLAIAEVPRLTEAIDTPLGVVWLVAAALLVGTAVALFVWPTGWWAVGAVAIVVSQLVIVSSWTDARFGTISNVIALAGARSASCRRALGACGRSTIATWRRASVEPPPCRSSPRPIWRPFPKWCSGTSA